MTSDDKYADEVLDYKYSDDELSDPKDYRYDFLEPADDSEDHSTHYAQERLAASVKLSGSSYTNFPRIERLATIVSKINSILGNEWIKL